MAKKSTRKTPRKPAKKPAIPSTSVTPLKTPKSPQTRIEAVRPKLPSVWQLTRQTGLLLWQHKRLFLLLTLSYGILNIILVRGIGGGSDVSALKQSLSQGFHGQFGALASSASVFVVLLSSSGNNSSSTAGAYQLVLALIISLAVIWSLRQVTAGTTNFRVRDAYYKGMYPLIPFILVLLVVCLQLIPMVVGSSLYALVMSNGIAVHVVEKLFWFVLFIGLSILSLFWLTSSLFALYIVTLPDMTPVQALRSAKELTRGRRWSLLRKIVWLPLCLVIAAALIMLPIIVIFSPAAQWAFFILTMFGLVVIHAYMYGLYRELLHE